MNDFGNRLDTLATSATRNVTLVDPSTAVSTTRLGQVTAPSPRRAGFAGWALATLAVALVVGLAGMAFWWQLAESEPQSVVASQGSSNQGQDTGSASAVTDEADSTVEADEAAALAAAREAAEAALAQAAAAGEDEVSSGDGPRGSVASERARWRAADIGDYTFTYSVMYPGQRRTVVVVLVEDGEATVVEVVEGDSDSPPLWTVEDLFDMAEDADEIRQANYDLWLGYPTLLSLDPERDRVDDEIRITVSDLFSIADIDTANRTSVAWFDQPIDLPLSLVPVVTRIGELPVSDVYRLHTGDVHAYVYRVEDSLCLLTAVAVEGWAEFSQTSSACLPETTFALEGARTAYPGGQRHPYLVIVPPFHYLGQNWNVEVDSQFSHRTEVGARSVRIVFDDIDAAEQAHADSSISGRVQVRFTCDCGGLVYEYDLSSAN